MYHPSTSAKMDTGLESKGKKEMANTHKKLLRLCTRQYSAAREIRISLLCIFLAADSFRLHGLGIVDDLLESFSLRRLTPGTHKILELPDAISL